LFGFNYLKMESSGESIKFHYNMGCLEHLSSFLKEILYLAISIHDVPWFISTIMFLHTSALVSEKYVEWWLAGQNLITLRETCTAVTLSTVHPTRTAMEMSSGVCYKKPEPKYLSYGTARIKHE
jgi:hypothetical protein